MSFAASLSSREILLSVDIFDLVRAPVSSSRRWLAGGSTRTGAVWSSRSGGEQLRWGLCPLMGRSYQAGKSKGSSPDRLLAVSDEVYAGGLIAERRSSCSGRGCLGLLPLLGATQGDVCGEMSSNKLEGITSRRRGKCWRQYTSHGPHLSAQA